MVDVDMPPITAIKVERDGEQKIIGFGQKYEILRPLRDDETFLLSFERVNGDVRRDEMLLIKTLYRNDDDQKRRAENEVRITSLEHDNIVEYRETLEDKNRSSWYLVMKYYELGRVMNPVNQTPMYNVLDKLQGEDDKMPVVTALRALLEVHAGLNFLHLNGIVHKDLKPENILVDEYLHMKLIDFGISVFTSDGSIAFTDPGTLGYFPPEVGKLYLNQSEEIVYDGYKADIYSLGVTYHVFLQNILPITDIDSMDTYAHCIAEITEIPIVASDDPNRDHQLEISNRMMSIAPTDRPTMDQLKIEVEQHYQELMSQ